MSDAKTDPRAEKLVAEAHAHDGLAPVDLDRFWADQEVALADPFGADIPQCPLGVLMSDECVYDELGIEEDFWRYENDQEWAFSLNKVYNDKAEKIVGWRPLHEKLMFPELRYPWPGGLHDVFEGKNVWHAGSWWLEQVAHNEDELKALLDRVEGRLTTTGAVRDLILPDGWAEAKEKLMAEGIRPPLYRGQRGPCTFATSIYGPENLIFLCHDNPDLAARFSRAILNSMLAIARVLDEEAGYRTPGVDYGGDEEMMAREEAPHGFGWADDNSQLLTPAMYELFGAPVLKGIWDRYSPDPGDYRQQHSDSSMEHIVPILGRLGITSTNFGPTVMVDYIRKHCPKAVIYGELAPFTFSRNDEVGIVNEFLRDFGMAKEKRGLVFATAGSINNGSRITGMRLIMAAIQRYGRYE